MLTLSAVRGTAHGGGTLRYPKRKGKPWAGGDVLVLDGCCWFSAKSNVMGAEEVKKVIQRSAG